MFQLLALIWQAWAAVWQFFYEFRQELLHVSALTGLSVSALSALAVAAFFIPQTRHFAAWAVLAVILGNTALGYGYKQGIRDERAAWKAANEIAKEQAKARDAEVRKEVLHEFGPMLAHRDMLIAELQRKADEYAKTHPDSCQLGDDALRLRNPARVPPRTRRNSPSGSKSLRPFDLRAIAQAGPAPQSDGED